MLHRFTATFVAFCLSLAAFGQVTTATIVGLVRGTDGASLPGARIEAVHTPSGSRYGSAANAEGRFTLPNMRVGGPYTVTVTMQSFEAQKFDGIELKLGQKLVLNAALKETSTSIGEVVVNANANDVVNNNRTGATTNIRREQLAALPTIGRGAKDFTRLSPAADGESFGGRNDQFNNFSVDGATFNNPFGLDAATVGGQSDAQPISLDAIDQIQISYAPYDVTQSNFTGAAVNAVTKSGNNEFTGSVFGFYRNQSLVGSKVGGVAAPKGDLTQLQTGFRLGGPIVKNKLFFFVNAELERRSDLGSAYLPNRGAAGPGISRVLASDLEMVSNALKNKFQYDAGAYENFTLDAPNQKAIAKLDWNISTAHKFSITYNFLDGTKEKPAHPVAIGRRGPDFTTLHFSNAGYAINNKMNSVIADLKSTFSDRFSNKLQVGKSSFKDTRDAFSAPFPTISIAKDGVRYIIAGQEPFSVYNKLNQDVFQINDNLNIYLGKHTLTVGGAFEKFKFENCFNLGTIPGVFAPDFVSPQAFVDSVNTGALDAWVNGARTTFANNKDQDWNWAYTNVGQVSAYVQDEISFNDRLTVTLGLRMDKPMYFNTKDLIAAKLAKSPDYAPNTEYYDETGAAVKFDHTVLPSTKALINPRIGFNYDVMGNQTLQFRGGTGLFSGRFPFVWVGNQVANPNWYFYCVTKPDFQFPQVWRTNLGADQKLEGGWVVSADLIYTKDINGMMVRNYGLKLPGGRLNAPGDTRPIYRPEDRAAFTGFGFPITTNAYVFTNTNIGYSTNMTLQVQKTWSDGMFGSLGYNFTQSKDASSIDAEISSDAYDRNPAYGNVNEAVLGHSIYGNRHRIVGSFSKKFSYGGADGNRFATSLGLFLQYAQGGRFSYTYSGDLNNDGSGNNDLIFIPTDAQIEQMQFGGTNAAEQKAAFKAFVNQDGYMSDHRGEVAEKYAVLSPWYSNWDLRILQDLNHKAGKKTNTVQLSIDILNIGNLVNNNWGVRQIPTASQPLGVNVAADGTPTFSFDTSIKDTFVQDFSLLSRWQMQVGLRYSF